MNTIFDHHINPWIAPNTVLEGSQVLLKPLESTHFQDLIALGREEKIWESFPSSRSDEFKHYIHLSESLDGMSLGSQHAFVIIEKSSGEIAGMTRLYHLSKSNRQLEIGSWLHPNFWGMGINTEVKYLLLALCFEELKTIRVQFRTDKTNIRSCRALEKIGANLEGIIRNERIREDGTFRDAAIFSILDQEWMQTKNTLLKKMNQYQLLSLAS
jgi:N-acetyltransferase